MEQFDESVMSAFDILEDFTDERANCLNTFLNCQDLVKWLKESMHTCKLCFRHWGCQKQWSYGEYNVVFMYRTRN